MKTVEVEVRSMKKVLGSVKVEQCESLEEAIKASSKATVLSIYNKAVAAKVTNDYRTEKTKTSSPLAQLAKAMKTNPDVKAQIASILENL